MNMFRFLVAAAAIGGFAAPVAAQYAYPSPQAYPGTPYAYGYQQDYNPGYANNTVGAIINQLLGNRYNVTDRTAVIRCANAAMVQAQNQYSGYGYSQRYGSPQGNGYPQGIAAPAMRVTAITDVQRRNNGLRVRGLMNSGHGSYGGQYGYQNQAYASGDLTFRCNVDYRGAVTKVRIGRNNGYRG